MNDPFTSQAWTRFEKGLKRPRTSKFWRAIAIRLRCAAQNRVARVYQTKENFEYLANEADKYAVQMDRIVLRELAAVTNDLGRFIS